MGIAEGAMARVAGFRHFRQMDVQELKQLFERTGKTQRGLAEALNIDPGVITRIMNGTREIKVREIPVIRAYFGEPDRTLTQTERLQNESQPHPLEVVPADLPAHMAAVGAWPRTVPVLGTTVGGADAAFLLNRGETIDYAKRPPTLAKSSQVFALYVQGDSMARWRMPGEIVYVDKRPAKAGDHVVVECHPDHEGEGHPAYLKQLVTQTGKVYRLRQYNPEKIIEIPMSKVIAVFRVIEWSELAGL